MGCKGDCENSADAKRKGKFPDYRKVEDNERLEEAFSSVEWCGTRNWLYAPSEALNFIEGYVFLLLITVEFMLILSLN